jgi:uncharacterized protein (TIGR02466 family)
VSAYGLLLSLRQGLSELKPGGAWQSGHALHGREELHELCDYVGRAAASVLQFLNIGEGEIRITGCWSNLYASGAAHRAHSHRNNYLSAASYVSTWHDAGTINFHDPRSLPSVIRPQVTALTFANTVQVVVRAQDGTLLVLPSYRHHSVDANASGESRASVGFNLMCCAFTDALDKPLWAHE